MRSSPIALHISTSSMNCPNIVSGLCAGAGDDCTDKEEDCGLSWPASRGEEDRRHRDEVVSSSLAFSATSIEGTTYDGPPINARRLM